MPRNTHQHSQQRRYYMDVFFGRFRIGGSDLLARFSKPKSLLDLVRLERMLSEVLGRKTDLLTEASISPYLRDRIKNEMEVVYERAG